MAVTKGQARVEGRKRIGIAYLATCHLTMIINQGREIISDNFVSTCVNNLSIAVDVTLNSREAVRISSSQARKKSPPSLSRFCLMQSQYEARG
jgi:hypothetical protein